MPENSSEKPTRRKIQILEEHDYKIEEMPPPNFHPWFLCIEKWDRWE